MYPSRASILMSGLACSNSALSSRNFLRSTASVVGGNPLTVIVTWPPAEELAGAFEQAPTETPRAATASSPAARPNSDRFIAPAPSLEHGVDRFVTQTIQTHY